MAIHLEPAFQDKFGKVSLPVTEKALRETVILPLYPQMTEEEHDYVLQGIKEVLAGK
jgi:dTDP-4-amino-4,6-dideoxygalactose transaminase